MTETEKKLAQAQSVMALECRNCQHRWPEIHTMPMPIEAFIGRGRSIRCPHCGNFEGPPPRDAILLLTGDRYREAMVAFRSRGLIPPAVGQEVEQPI